MGSFGEWLREKRNQEGLDLSILAQQAGVDKGTVSRIENNRTQPNMHTVIQLWEALKMSRMEVVREFGGDPQKLYCPLDWSPEGYPPEGHPPVLTVSDAVSFVECYDRNPKKARYGMANLLNQLTDALHSDNPRREYEDLIGTAPHYKFLPEEIPKLLVDSPFYQFDPQYPTNIEADLIRHICNYSGLLIERDVGAFIRAIREDYGLSLRNLGAITKISYSSLSRLETGARTQIKLKQILQLDKALDQEGNLLDMYWVAHKSEIEIANRFFEYRRPRILADDWPQKGLKLVSILVIASRWLQHLLGVDDTAWIDDLRERFDVIDPK